MPTGCSLDEFLSLMKISGLNRLASNWVRLVLRLLSALPAWFCRVSSDSWRFEHVDFTHYPVHRGNKEIPSTYEFDSSLGFPGEGPFDLGVSSLAPLDFLFHAWTSIGFCLFSRRFWISFGLEWTSICGFCGHCVPGGGTAGKIIPVPPP